MPAGRKTQSPGRGGKRVQAILAPPIADGRRQRLPVDSGVQAGVDQAARQRLDDHPGLGLSPVRLGQPGGGRIVGMDLDGECFGRVEELQQQGETRLRVVPSQQFRAAPSDQFVQRRAGQGAKLDYALVRLMIDDFPAFGPNARPAAALCQATSPTAAPPRDMAAERVESEAGRAKSWPSTAEGDGGSDRSHLPRSAANCQGRPP